MTASPNRSDSFSIAGRDYHSRLLVGTGKYKDMDETARAIAASGAEIVTIAVRRTNIGQNADEPNVLEVLPPDRYTILPNTAGCYDVDSAVRTCRLARELLDGHNLVKLEVLGDRRPCSPICTKPSKPPRCWSPMASTSWSTPTTTRSSPSSSRTSAAWR